MPDEKKNHVKPTKEEMEAKDKQDLVDLENIKAEDDKKSEKVEKEAEDIPSDSKEQDEKNEEPESDQEGDSEQDREAEEIKELKEGIEDEEVPEEEPDKDSVDYKKKFSDSTRENQVLHSKLKSFEKASTVPEPTDKDMGQEYPDWEVMDDFDKKVAKNIWKQAKRNQATDEMVADSKKVDKWNKSVDEFVDDPKTLIDNSNLEGKLDEFKIFVSKPSRRGADFDDLVSAFLYRVGKDKPTKKKGKMIETGTGGPSKKSKPKSDKLTIEQGALLKKKNYNEYKRLLNAGKIEDGF